MRNRIGSITLLPGPGLLTSGLASALGFNGNSKLLCAMMDVDSMQD